MGWQHCCNTQQIGKQQQYKQRTEHCTSHNHGAVCCCCIENGFVCAHHLLRQLFLALARQPLQANHAPLPVLSARRCACRTKIHHKTDEWSVLWCSCTPHSAHPGLCACGVCCVCCNPLSIRLSCCLLYRRLLKLLCAGHRGTRGVRAGRSTNLHPRPPETAWNVGWNDNRTTKHQTTTRTHSRQLFTANGPHHTTQSRARQQHTDRASFTETERELQLVPASTSHHITTRTPWQTMWATSVSTFDFLLRWRPARPGPPRPSCE